MPDLERIPVLVFDDGSPIAALALDRALAVASHITLAVAHESVNHPRNVSAAEAAGVSLDVRRLAQHSGIRQALAICAEEEIYLAFVPRSEVSASETLREVIQAAAHAERAGLPVLAVYCTGPSAPRFGPVVDVDPAESEDGFAALFAAGLAADLRVPLHVVRLAGDADHAQLRAADAMRRARDVLAHHDVPVYEELTSCDPLDEAEAATHGASAVVLGVGSYEVAAQEPTDADDLPGRVLDNPDGRLARRLLEASDADVVVVCDAIDIHYGSVARGAAVAGAAGAITAGAAKGSRGGVVAAAAAVSAAAVHVADRSD